MNVEEHFELIERETKRAYASAELARAKGLDPVKAVEVPIATSLAEKTVGLISVVYPQLLNSGVVERILELEKEYGQLDTAVAFRIAEDVAREKFCKFKDQIEAIDAGVRLGFSYITLGVVSSPIEGFTGLKLAKTKEGKDYFVAYFSGPIRSAGTTASCMVLMLIDYLRETFGYAKYDPSENEVKRYVTENYDYHERVNNLQYLPTEEEITFLAQNLPIQISGEPSEEREVSNYKDLERVETNQIRGGMCLIFSEGLAQKAQKGLRLLRSFQDKGFKATGWNFLDEYVKIHKKREKGTGDTTATYIKDIVAGRPVFSHPSRHGGFRFRYGRSRTIGFSAFGLHPATMGITENFIAYGTQLKIEKPTKGGVIGVCDSIDGPIVKFRNGSVKKIMDFGEAKAVYKDVEEIIYLGDILFPFGDVANRNYELLKPGYVEEWWYLELQKKNPEIKLDKFKVDFDNALELSRKYEIPLHPEYIYYWNEADREKFLGLIDWIVHGHIINGSLILPYNHSEKERFRKGKRGLELIGCEHKVTTENVVLLEKDTRALLFNLGIEIGKGENMENKLITEKMDEKIKNIPGEEKTTLEIINILSSLKIKDKLGSFIGARMGRPEKAKLRKLTGSPHAMFPVGEEGGRLRSFQEAVEVGKVNAEFPVFYCNNCQQETIYGRCEVCGWDCIKQYYCKECNVCKDEVCPIHKIGVEYREKSLDIKRYMDSALKNMGARGEEIPLFKGIRGTSNKEHSCENLMKGMLRAKYNLNVNKDGTIRYDMTELPITHFKPKEIGTSVEKLKELGYTHDAEGAPLENEEQILLLFPHDVLLPACTEGDDEKADDVFFKITKFVDDELEYLYKLPRYFNGKKKEEVVGQLVVCIAPHICTATVGRIIGFVKSQGLLASPFMHAAMRRDCFGYNTFIPLKKDGIWKNVKLGEFVESIKPDNIIDGWGTKEKKVYDFETIGINKEIREVKINNFTKHTKAPFYEVSTSSGRKIEVTDNHKFLIDGKIKRARELRIGDKLPVPIKINIGPEEVSEINLAEMLRDEDLMIRGIKRIVSKLNQTEINLLLNKLKISRRQFSNFDLRDSYPLAFVLSLDDKTRKLIYKLGKIATKRDSVNVPILININKDLLEILGLYVAEGYSRSIRGSNGLNQVYLASNEKEIRDFIKKTVFKNFGLLSSERKEDRVTFSSRVFYLFITKVLGAGSSAYEKRVPSMFLGLPLEKLAAFLRGYFEGDGSAEKGRKKVSCDSVSEGLLSDLEFCLGRFGIFVKRYEYEKEPGPKVREFYIKKNRKVPIFKITKLIIGSDFVDNFRRIGFISQRKRKILEDYKKIKPYGMKLIKDNNFVYDPIISIRELGEKESYCLNVKNKNHLVVANNLLSLQCDGDEAAAMLLMDMLLNFSRKFLPAHRGGTQDAPLVLNTRIRAGEVDDQILDFEMGTYPLELYEMAEQGKHSSEMKMIDNVKMRMKKGLNPFSPMSCTHSVSDINAAPMNSSYKSLPTMGEKVAAQMELCGKIRAVDTDDVARLIIERHFIRDIRGNLRKFSQQEFRCVGCNGKYRRPPLGGKCTKCGGKLIFTISEGSVLKYMQPALELGRKFGSSPYLIENLELTEMYIQSIFGKEKEKQEGLGKWF